jgi:hypothetical protein
MRHILITVSVLCCVFILPAVVANAHGPARSDGSEIQELKGLDAILDTYVRDGEVYYRALKLERGRLDAYVNQLGAVAADKLSRDERLAFWINAYNALVLKTVVDHYPIQGRSAAYPQKSIRQIPGAFERLPHRVAGRTLTLDQIEQTVLREFQDPRIYFAIGRGAEGGGRRRSEAESAAECVTRKYCLHIDRDANKVTASPIFSWREQEFVATYADRTPPVFASRAPVERAILAFAWPKLLTTEKETLEKNSFQVGFGQFDWHLNDLTGRGGP